MSLTDPDSEDNAQVRKVIERTRKILTQSFRANLNRIKRQRLDKWKRASLEDFYDSMEDVIKSEFACPELLLIRNETRELIRPYLEPEPWSDTNDESERQT